MAQVPPAALRVLFVEDSSDDVELISRELGRHGFTTESRAVESRDDFLEALASGNFDVILSDHSMKGFNSTEALRLLHEQAKDIPFIIVSGTIGEDAAVDAMRAGAHDYVLKQNLRRLGPAVERELREAANRRVQRSTHAALQASEQRLHHAQRMESVGRLAAGIAHDFNNLLTVILGFSEFLIDRLPPDEGAHRDASEIRTAAQRATGLTKQLLAFSRQQVLERRVVDLVAAVNDLQPMIRRLIGENLHCEFDLARSAAAGADRSRSIRAGAPEPGDQRQGRDAGRRPPQRVDLAHPHQWPTRVGPGCEGRRVRHAVGGGQWSWHRCRNP